EAGTRPPRAEARRAVVSVRDDISVGALVCIDLRFLEAAGEVHVDRLPFREDVQARDPGLPVAVARVLHAAEGKVDLGPDGRGIDVEDPGLEVAHRPERPFDVTGVDG